MKPRWILLSLLASLVLAWLTHWYQTKAAWTVTLKPGSSLLGISDDRQTIFLDENTEPTIYPSTLSKRSLATGQLLQQIELEKNDAPWHDSADVRVSPDQRYLIMTEGYRRDSRGIAVLYDLTTGKPVKQWSLISFPHQAISFSMNSQHLILGTADSSKPDDDHVIRLLNLGTMTEQSISVPRDHDTRLVQVLPSADMSFLAAKVVNRRDQGQGAFVVYLINPKNGKVVGSWECCDEPLIQTGPNSFGFQVKSADQQQQFVVVHSNEQPENPQPVEGIVFNIEKDREPPYHFRSIDFHRFSDYEPYRLFVSSINTSSTGAGIGLMKVGFNIPPIPWLHEQLINWNILRITLHFRWLDINSRTCSEPVSVSEHGMTEVLPSGVVNLDNHHHLRYFPYPSRWRWYITAGMALLPFIALLLLRKRTVLVPGLRPGTHCTPASGRLQS